jgi:hypothetical protein
MRNMRRSIFARSTEYAVTGESVATSLGRISFPERGGGKDGERQEERYGEAEPEWVRPPRGLRLKLIKERERDHGGQPRSSEAKR